MSDNKRKNVVPLEKPARDGAASRHDPTIIELIKLMARISAKRDYSDRIMSNNESLREVPDHE